MMAPTMMPMVAPLLRPVLAAAAVLDGGGTAAAEVELGVADVELDELDEEVVSLAAADFTALAAAPAAPIKALRGFVAAAACAATAAALEKAIAAERRICRCIVEAEVMKLKVRRLLREHYQR